MPSETYTRVETVEVAKVLTTTGTSANVELIGRDNKCDQLSLHVAASAVTGTTPSTTIEVQWSNDGTNFYSAETPDTFAAITAAKNVVKQFPVKGQAFRLSYAVSGTTPSFTLTVTALIN